MYKFYIHGVLVNLTILQKASRKHFNCQHYVHLYNITTLQMTIIASYRVANFYTYTYVARILVKAYLGKI